MGASLDGLGVVVSLPEAEGVGSLGTGDGVGAGVGVGVGSGAGVGEGFEYVIPVLFSYLFKS